MYCSACGFEMPDGYRYCPQCAAAAQKDAFAAPSRQPARLLNRSRTDRKLAGVCAGIARYLGVDVTLIRVLAVVLALWPPAIGLIIYLVCWAVMPQEPLLLPAPSKPGPDVQPQNMAVS